MLHAITERRRKLLLTQHDKEIIYLHLEEQIKEELQLNIS